MYTFGGTHARMFLRAYRAGYLVGCPGVTAVDLAPPPRGRCAKALEEIGGHIALLRDGEWRPPYELIVPSSESRPQSEDAVSRVISRALPPESFIRLSDDICIPGPELQFILAAGEMHPLEHIAFGMELCGTYSLLPFIDSQQSCAYQCPAETSVGAIARMAEALRGMKGARMARRSLKYVVEGSASPMETLCACMMRLPVCLGGYGVGAPQLNPELIVPKAKRHLTRLDKYHPDIFFQEYELDLEYESREGHPDPDLVASYGAVARARAIDKVEQDKQRLRDIQAIGIRVMPVTPADFHSLENADRLARQVYEHIREVTGARLDWRARNLAAADARTRRWQTIQILRSL